MMLFKAQTIKRIFNCNRFSKMTAKQKKMLIRIIIASVLLIALALSPITGYLRLALFLIPYFIVGYDILLKAAKGIANGRVFDENLLMTVATLGAIAIALYDNTGDYTEAVAVMLFYQIGEWFQAYAVGKSRKNISELMDIRPDYANIEQNGQLEKVDPDEVEIGTIIVVQPGEKVPIDGVVLTKYANAYEFAQIGKPLFKMADVSTLILRAYVTADILTQVKLNDTATIMADFGKENMKKYTGSIIWISDKAEFTPKTIPTRDERSNLVYAVKIQVKNDGYLRKGMYGEVLFNNIAAE